MTDAPIVRIGGNVFSAWETLSVTRNIDRMASDVRLRTSPIYSGKSLGPISEFAPITVSVGPDLILTGYLNRVETQGDARQHAMDLIARSKTQDILDCTPDVPGGTYSGYHLDQIARAVASLFGVDVVVQAALGEPFAEATMERHETGFVFLERLARLRGVLLSDDEQGRLLLTTAGSSRATDTLRLGHNVTSVRVLMDSTHRFSEYRVKTEATPILGFTPRPLGSPEPPPVDPSKSVADQYAAQASWAQANFPQQTPVMTVTTGQSYDAGVPRYRLRTMIAESALDSVGARARAAWQARYNAARGQQIAVDIRGFRQADGTLWRHNQIVAVDLGWASISQDLLIAGITYEFTPQGAMTRLRLGPVDAYAPDPGEVKFRKSKAGGALGLPGLVPVPQS